MHGSGQAALDPRGAADLQPVPETRRRKQLSAAAGTIRDRDEQRKRMIWAAAAGVVAGFMLFPLIGRVLSESLSSRMEATAIGGDG